MALPIIDISSWNSISSDDVIQQDIATQWNSALRDYGCVIVIGHGIEESTFDNVNSEAKIFFEKSAIERMRYSRGSYGHPLGGYTPAGVENVEKSFDEKSNASTVVKKASDPVENFVFTSSPNQFIAPDEHSPNPIPSADAYYTTMNSLLRTIHSISCSALSIPDKDFFESYYDESHPQNKSKSKNGNCLRLAHYLPQVVQLNSDTSNGEYNKILLTLPYSALIDIRYGAHTDFQGFTILRPDKSDWHSRRIVVEGQEYLLTCGGLEVYNRNEDQWIAVKIPQHLNALVINAGDLIQRWTNDYWLSPIHRVVAKPVITKVVPPSGDDTETSNRSSEMDLRVEIPGRQAIVFFTGPLEDCIVEVLPLPHIQQHRGGAVYPPVRSGDWLQMKLNKINI